MTPIATQDVPHAPPSAAQSPASDLTPTPDGIQAEAGLDGALPDNELSHSDDASTEHIRDDVGLSESPAPDAPVSRKAQLTAQLAEVPSVLEKLFALYPQLFGAQFLPLKLGIFQELMARHPNDFSKDSLKLALGQHTRSTRYLQCVAAGFPRHDLAGEPVEPVAPEHVYGTMLELFRRRQRNAREDLRPKFRAQLISAFEASGLSRQDYAARVQTNDEHATALLEEALAEHAEKVARQAALLTAYDSSGKTPAEFADMYGMDQRLVVKALAQRNGAKPSTA